MLRIITDKFQQGVSYRHQIKTTDKFFGQVCDEVMETAWSTMWNVTDETPVNCERFLNGGGMYLFLKCKVGTSKSSVSVDLSTYLVLHRTFISQL